MLTLYSSQQYKCVKQSTVWPGLLESIIYAQILWCVTCDQLVIRNIFILMAIIVDCYIFGGFQYINHRLVDYMTLDSHVTCAFMCYLKIECSQNLQNFRGRWPLNTELQKGWIHSILQIYTHTSKISMYTVLDTICSNYSHKTTPHYKHLFLVKG